MDIGVFFSGLAFIVVAFAIVGFLRRARPEADPEEVLAKSPDVGWAAGFQPKPITELPDDLVPTGDVAPVVEEDLLHDYLFDADELRAVGREQARRRLLTLHFPADQLEEVLDAIFAE